jgi:hypothetical protein
MKYESELEHIEQFSEEEREEIASFYDMTPKYSDTPETDALVDSINSDSDIIRHEYDFVEMTKFARQLERERDDLRDRLNELLNRPTLV